MCRSGRGQVLLPWPNRLDAGSYEFDGRRHQLPLNDPQENAAIHGLVRWAAWRPARAHARQRGDGARDPPSSLYPATPFRLELRIEYPADRDKTGSRRAHHGHQHRERESLPPTGAARIPYLRVLEATPTIDTVILRAPGRTLLPVG